MPLPAFPDLSQLQGFIILDDIKGQESERIGYHGNKGMRLLLKLNDSHAVRFEWPMPVPKDGRVGIDVRDVGRGEKICPIDLGIDFDTLHAAIVQAGIGHYLLAKPPKKT